MNKLFFVLLILSFSLSYFAQLSYAQDSDNIVVLSHKFKEDAIIGEIKNNGKEPVNFVEITASFYDKNDDFIGSQSTYTKLNPLPPGIKSPFTLFVDDDVARTFFNYELMITWTNANSSKGMKIIEKPSSSIVEVECGMNVKGTVILDKDLTCSADGLTVKDNNVVINLNGHTIRGPGKDFIGNVGIIMNSFKNTSIFGPGKIIDYGRGISISDGQNITIQSIDFDETDVGILSKGNDIRIHDNRFGNNAMGVFLDRGNENSIKNNEFYNTEEIAISLLNSDRSVIENNNISNSLAGILLAPESINNSIVSNNVRDSEEIDIGNAEGLSPEENNNQFSDNICEKSDPEGLCE